MIIGGVILGGLLIREFVFKEGSKEFFDIDTQLDTE